MSAGLEAEHLYKVSGRRPGEAVERLRDGGDREELRADGITAAVVGASFTVEPGQIFVVMGLSGSDLDLNFDAWLPYAQANYWDKNKDRLADLGTWYEPTSLEIAVPSYVKGVKSYEDLKGKADLFDGRITGIEPGTGEMNLLRKKVLPGYGLDKEYDVVDGSTPAMLAELKRAYAKKQPVAVVLWSPHWAYSQYDLTKLKDDKKLFGEGNTIRTIANEKFPEQYPQLTKWIKNFRMSEDELGTLEAEINQRGQGHEEEAVAAWLKEHPDVARRMTPQ